MLKNPREVSGGVSFLQGNRLQLCNFAGNALRQKKKKMFKASNRDIKKRCLPVSKTTLKITERCRYLLKVTIQNHITMPICNQRSASVLLSSSTARNFNNSWPIYVIYEKWGIITELFHSWNIQNVSIFYFWKKQSQKWTNFSNVYLQRAAILVSQS